MEKRGLNELFWTVFASIYFIIPFLFFTIKLGFFNSQSDDDLMVIPAKIEQLDNVWRSLKCDTRINKNQHCFVTKYYYEYQGKQYTSNKFSEGSFVTTEANAIRIRNYLLDKSKIYISKSEPDYSVLINQSDFINNTPFSNAKLWFNPIMMIPVLGLLLFPLFSKKSYIKGDDISYRYSGIFFRFVALWCDISFFIAIIAIYISFTDIFTLSPYHENNIIPFAYLPIIFLAMLLTSRLMFLKSFGMRCNQLSFLRTDNHQKVSRKVIAIHFILSIITFLLSFGLVAILAAFNKKKQMLADQWCEIIVVQPFINEKYADRSRMLKHFTKETT